MKPTSDWTLNMVDKVDKVISFLENNKRQAVNRLFPGDGRDGYREEWMGRSTVKFWQHLDTGNRAELVEMAIEHYAEAK